MVTPYVKYIKLTKVANTILFPLRQVIKKTLLVSTRQIQEKTALLIHRVVTLIATHPIAPTWFQKMSIYIILYITSYLKNCLMTSRRWKLALIIVLPKKTEFFHYSSTHIHKQKSRSNFFTSSNKVIPFSKYLYFHLVLVLFHAKWANLILWYSLEKLV